MTEVQPPQPPDSRPPYRLYYATPEPSAGGPGFVFHMIMGFLLFWPMALLSLGLAFNVGPVIGFGTMAILVAVPSAMAIRHLSWRGFVAGELVGLGLVLLALGTCAGWFR